LEKSDEDSTTDEDVRKPICESVSIRRKESSKAAELIGVLGSITALSLNVRMSLRESAATFSK
jgi:hypothetical protein